MISLTLSDLPDRPALDVLHREFVADPDGNVLMFWGHVPAAG